jgi:bacteriocin-like protein
MESLNSMKFKVLNQSKLSSIIGGAVTGRTRTVNAGQTEPKCSTCRNDYERTVTVRHDD